MKQSQKRPKLDENDNYQKPPSPLPVEKTKDLENIQLKIFQLLKHPTNNNEFLKGAEEVLKDTLDAALDFDTYKDHKQIKNYLITGKQLTTLLHLIENNFGQDNVKKLLRYVNNNYDSILMIFAEHGDFEEFLEVLRILADIDVEFTKDFISFTNNDQRNVLHNICEFGKLGATREFLDFLLTTFNDDLFIRELLRSKAYSEPKNDVFFQRPKMILKHSPLRLLVFSRTKGVVNNEEFLRLLDWFHYNMEYQFIAELLSAEDSDGWNLMHVYTRFEPDVKLLILFLEWVIRNVKFDYVRNFLKDPIKNGCGALQIQARASNDPHQTTEFLQWMNGQFKRHDVKNLIKFKTEQNVNGLMAGLCHPNYLKKAQEVLKWVNIYFDRNISLELLDNYPAMLKDMVMRHQDLDSLMDLFSFIRSNYNPKDFIAFISFTGHNRRNFLHEIAASNMDIKYTKMFIKLLIDEVDEGKLLKFLLRRDNRKNNFMHYLFLTVENIKDIEAFLNWMIDTFEFEFMEKILKAQNKVGFIPLHMLIYNESEDNLKELQRVLYWKRKNLGPEFLLEIIQIKTKQNWQIFDLIARYKNDTSSLINIFNWLKTELTDENFKNIFMKPTSWSILHFMFRYNSSETNVTNFLKWLISKFELKFVSDLLQMNCTTTPIECLADNNSLSFINIMEYIANSVSFNLTVDAMESVMKKRQNSIFNIMLSSSHEKGEIENTINWMEKRCSTMLKEMIVMKDGNGKTALELAKKRGLEFHILLAKYMNHFGLY